MAQNKSENNSTLRCCATFQQSIIFILAAVTTEISQQKLSKINKITYVTQNIQPIPHCLNQCVSKRPRSVDHLSCPMYLSNQQEQGCFGIYATLTVI